MKGTNYEYFEEEAKSKFKSKYYWVLILIFFVALSKGLILYWTFSLHFSVIRNSNECCPNPRLIS